MEENNNSTNVDASGVEGVQSATTMEEQVSPGNADALGFAGGGEPCLKPKSALLLQSSVDEFRSLCAEFGITPSDARKCQLIEGVLYSRLAHSEEDLLLGTMHELTALGELTDALPKAHSRDSVLPSFKSPWSVSRRVRVGVLRTQERKGREACVNEILEELLAEVSEEIIEESFDDAVRKASGEKLSMDIVNEVVDEIAYGVAEEMTRILAFRSSAGDRFESIHAVVGAWPIVSAHVSAVNKEVSLPITSSVLSHVLQASAAYFCNGDWSEALLSAGVKDESKLEEVANAAKYLQLDELVAHCLSNLAKIVIDKSPERTCASLVAMQWALGSSIVSSSKEMIVALLCGLGLHSHRGDANSMASVLSHIDSQYSCVREAAVTTMGRLAPIDDPVFIRHSLRGLSDVDVQVQLAALSSVQTLGRNSKDVLVAVLERCGDVVVAVKSKAIQVIGQIAPRGDSSVMALVRNGLKDESALVRRASVEAYTCLYDQGDEQAFLDLIKCLEDIDESTREVALRAVSGNIEKSNSVAVNALLMQLEHCYYWVSAIALKALKYIGIKESDITDAILARLRHESASIREKAVEALARVASKGDPSVVDALMKYLQSSDAGVRHGAMEALKKIGRGDPLVVNAVVALLEEPRTRVKKTALKVLKLVGRRGNATILDAVNNHLRHDDEEVRIVALSIVTKFADKNCHKVIEGLCHNLLDADTKIQKLALVTFHKVVDKGFPFAVEALFSLLSSCEDARVYDRFVQVLPVVAGMDRESVDFVGSMIEKQNKTTRSFILQSLAHTVETKSKPCSFTVCSCWDDTCSGAETDLAESSSLYREGVSVVSRALSESLLRVAPNKFQDALLQSLDEIGFSKHHKSRPVRILHGVLDTCLHDRWPIPLDSIERLCTASIIAVKHADAALISNRQDGSRNACLSLHRPDCKHACSSPNSGKSGKRLKTGGG